MDDTVVEFLPCDTCGVRSYVFVDMPGDRDLAYCSHHATEYWQKLIEQAVRVIDLRHMVPTGRPNQEVVV